MRVRVVGEQHSSRHGEGLDPRRDVDGVAGETLGLDDHLSHVDPDPNANVLPSELLLDGDRGARRGERAREHAHAPVAEPLDDRPAERVVVALERSEVPLPLGDAELLVRLQQGRIADHVGEGHRDEPPLESCAHAATFSAARAGSSRLASVDPAAY